MLQLGTTPVTSERDGDDNTPLSLWTQEPDVPHCDLHTLASIGDYIRLQEHLERDRTQVSQKNKQGWTPLMYACYNGCGKSVEIILRYGAEKDARNPQGQSALMIAAYHGHCEAIKFFTEKEQIDAVDDRGWTALFYAVSGAHHNAVNILLQNGADANKVDKTEGMTAAMIAAAGGKESLVTLMLNNGADARLKSFEGHTVKSLAISRGYHTLARIVDRFIPEEFQKEVGIGRSVKDNASWLNYSMRETKSISSNMGCPTNHILQIALKEINLPNVLKFNNLDKYYYVFEEQNIDLGVFLTLTEDDLKNLGITLFGPRRKMSLVIKHLNSCDICHFVAKQKYSDSKGELGGIIPKLANTDQEASSFQAFSSPTWGSSLFSFPSRRDTKQ